MLDFIRETTTVWKYLQTTDKPVVLYGMGNGAEKILAQLAAVGKKPVGIFASDEFVRGQVFCGYTVQTYAAIRKQLEDFIVVLAFASERPQILTRFYKLATQHEVLAPHVPVFAGDQVVTPILLHDQAEKIAEVYRRLADNKSRQVFAGALNYKLSGKISYLEKITTTRRDDLQLLALGQQEVYVDGGAYNGDTLQEFMELTGGRYKKIYACEPDAHNFKKLQDAVRERQWRQVECIPQGLWSHRMQLDFSASSGRCAAFLIELCGMGLKQLPRVYEDIGQLKTRMRFVPVQVISLDELLGKNQATYVKLDVEGAELEVLSGAKQQLAGRPKLFVAAYHHDRDLWEIPLTLWALQPDYKIYLRKHPYVPDWELNFIAL